MEDIVEKIDKIIEKDDCWCIDYLPKQVEDWQKFAWLEKYLLTKKQKEQYADKIINIILKMIVYFESEFYIGDVYSKKLKKFQGYFKPETLKPKKLIDILKKMILSDVSVAILFESDGMVMSVGLYNTALYIDDIQDLTLLESIVASEGMFFRKSKGE